MEDDQPEGVRTEVYYREPLGLAASWERIHRTGRV